MVATVSASDSLRPAPETVSVEVAAARLGLSRSLAYLRARQDGTLVDGVPVLRCGRKMLVPTRALDRVLMVDPAESLAAQVA